MRKLELSGQSLGVLTLEGINAVSTELSLFPLLDEQTKLNKEINKPELARLVPGCSWVSCLSFSHVLLHDAIHHHVR